MSCAATLSSVPSKAIRRCALATEAIIRKLNPYELHGVLYYQIALSDVSAPEQVYMARLSHDVVYDAPAEGDTVLVDKLLSMVTGIRKKDT